MYQDLDTISDFPSVFLIFVTYDICHEKELTNTNFKRMQINFSSVGQSILDTKSYQMTLDTIPDFIFDMIMDPTLNLIVIYNLSILVKTMATMIALYFHITMD